MHSNPPPSILPGPELQERLATLDVHIITIISIIAITIITVILEHSLSGYRGGSVGKVLTAQA